MSNQYANIFFIIFLMLSDFSNQAKSMASDYLETLFGEQKYDDIFSIICPKATGPCSDPIDKYENANHEQRKMISGIEFLGEGSFGKVYSLDGKWAVKTMTINSIDMLKYTMTEINVGLKIQESNLPYLTPIKDCCVNVSSRGNYKQDIYTFYIGMPLYKLGTLRNFMKNPSNRNTLATADWKWSVIFGLMNGLKYLHNASYSHRDLKPMNVLMESPYKVRISDFGLTKKIFDKAHTMLGTPAYMAPEILANDSYNNKVDIYSAGLMMFEILNALGYKEKVVNVKDIQKYCDGRQFASYSLENLEWESYCGSGLSELILEMISKNPDNRPSAEKVLERITNSPQEFFNREERAVRFTNEISQLPIGNSESEYRMKFLGLGLAQMIQRPSVAPRKSSAPKRTGDETPRFNMI